MIAIFTIFGFGRWLQFADIAIERLIFDHNSLIFQLRDLISRYSASIFDCNSEILVLSCSTCCCGSYFQSSILRFRWSIQWSFIWWLQFSVFDFNSGLKFSNRAIEWFNCWIIIIDLVIEASDLSILGFICWLQLADLAF